MPSDHHQESTNTPSPSMPTRPLGRTGHEVGLFSLGGQGVIEQADTEQTAIAVVRRALELGVNYIDTAPRYSAGARESERNIGKALDGDRQRVFLGRSCTRAFPFHRQCCGSKRGKRQRWESQPMPIQSP